MGRVVPERVLEQAREVAGVRGRLRRECVGADDRLAECSCPGGDLVQIGMAERCDAAQCCDVAVVGGRVAARERLDAREVG